MKCKNPKTFITAFLFSMFALSGASFFVNARMTPVRADSFVTSEDEARYKEIADSCVDVSPNLLTTQISRINSAPTSKFVQVDFKTSVPDVYKDSSGSVFFTIPSNDYTGNISDYKGSKTPFDVDIVRLSAPRSGNVQIVKQYNYGSYLVLTPTRILQNTASSYSDDSGREIVNIYIPETIIHIEKDAFVNVPNSVTIYCDFMKDSAEHVLEEGWTDAKNIIYRTNESESILPEGYKSEGTCSPDSKGIEGISDTPFILNYAGLHTEHFDIDEQPLVYSFKYVGEEERNFRKAKIQSTKGDYDGVGRDIISDTVTLEIIINHEHGANVDMDTLEFYGLHEAEWVKNLDADLDKNPDAGIYVPNLEQTFSIIPSVSATCQQVNVDEVITYSEGSVHTFNDYMTVDWHVNKVFDESGKTYYELTEKGIGFITGQYAKNFESGEYTIRFGLSNLSNSSFDVTYLNKNNELVVKNVPIKTDDGVLELWKNENNTLTFLLKYGAIGEDFEISRLRAFAISGVTVTMECYNLDTHSRIKGTNEDVKFGDLYIVEPREDSVSPFRVDLMVVIVYLIYIPLYAALTTGLYFYLKNKFKNDEFRRVKPKRYLKKTLVGFAGSLIILGMILAIISRFGLFANSMSVYNPIDVFVVFFTLVGVVIAGLFIKALVDMIKAEKQLRKNERLKLNDDVSDDGTN